MCNTLVVLERCFFIQIEAPYTISDPHVNKVKVVLSAFLSVLTKQRNGLKYYDLNHLENVHIAVYSHACSLLPLLSYWQFSSERDICLEPMH